jgi:hypothetical protein
MDVPRNTNTGTEEPRNIQLFVRGLLMLTFAELELIVL